MHTPPNDFQVSCPYCSAELEIPSDSLAAEIKCPACANSFAIDTTDIPSASQKARRSCCGCGVPLELDSTFCIHCGTDQKTRKAVATDWNGSDSAPSAIGRKPYRIATIIGGAGITLIVIIAAFVFMTPRRERTHSTAASLTANDNVRSGSPAGTTPAKTQSVDLGDGVKLELVRIPAGKFLMGFREHEPGMAKDNMQHPVTLPTGFWMGKYEVTQEQWEKVMGKSRSGLKRARDPVEAVRWDECQEFIEKVNGLVRDGGFRLPTEAEWEYACRAGTTTPFHYGEGPDVMLANFDGTRPYGNGTPGKCRGKALPVGSLPPNKWGLFDMHGNVSEWCEDWHGPYPTNSVTYPTGAATGDHRIHRGGGWSDEGAHCSSAWRGALHGVDPAKDVGFRLVRDNIVPGSPKPLSFAALKAKLSVAPSISRDDKSNYVFNATIRGLGLNGAKPNVVALRFEGRDLSPNMLIHSGNTAILTNLPVTVRTGVNAFFLHVDFSVASTGSVDHKLFVSASTHVNRANTNAPPELPELMSVSPYTEFPLFTDGEAYQFSDAHPFRVDYHDYDPGVDTSRVKIEAGGSSKGSWTDVTAHFDRRSSSASLKPGHCFDLPATNPTMRVSVPELDYPVPSVFSLTYRMLPTSYTNVPYVTYLSRHAYMRGISTTIELRGINLVLVKDLWLCERAHTTNRQPLKIKYLRPAARRGRESKNLDTMTVLVTPYRTGIFCLQMNGLIQTQYPLLMLDSPDSFSRSEHELDQSLKKVPDRNGDGIISAVDLDIDGDGLPDSGAIVFPSRSIDLDGDGLPNEFDHEPLKPNTNYMRFRSGPQDLSNVVEVMRTLGHVNPSPGSKDEAGPMVIMSPVAP